MEGSATVPQCFYKYTTLESALKIIESKSFIWRTPTQFNDPFDHQSGFVLDTSQEELARRLNDAVERLIFEDGIPLPEPTTPFLAAMLEMRRNRHRLPRAEVMADLRQGGLEVAARVETHLDEFNATIQNNLAHARVFCVSELPNNVVMWSHYASEHRGVVFKLRCIPELDNRLIAARPVQYSDRFLPFTEQYLLHMSGERQLDLAQACWKIPFIKHLDWAYEREWRVYLPMLDEPPGDGTSLLSEDASVFGAIYLGCRMTDADIDRVRATANRSLPAMKLFRATQSKRAFALSFTEL